MWTAPHTYVVNEALSAGLLNTDHRDNIDYLHGDAAWIAPAMLNGWVNYGAPYSNAGYRRFGDRVAIRGAFKNGTENAVIFNLPVGYRPSTTLVFPCWMVEGTGQGWAYASVAANGDVKHVRIGNSAPASPGNDFVSLDAVAFDLLP